MSGFGFFLHVSCLHLDMTSDAFFLSLTHSLTRLACRCLFAYRVLAASLRCSFQGEDEYQTFWENFGKYLKVRRPHSRSRPCPNASRGQTPAPKASLGALNSLPGSCYSLHKPTSRALSDCQIRGYIEVPLCSPLVRTFIMMGVERCPTGESTRWS